MSRPNNYISNGNGNSDEPQINLYRSVNSAGAVGHNLHSNNGNYYQHQHHHAVRGSMSAGNNDRGGGGGRGGDVSSISGAKAQSGPPVAPHSGERDRDLVDQLRSIQKIEKETKATMEKFMEQLQFRSQSVDSDLSALLEEKNEEVI